MSQCGSFELHIKFWWCSCLDFTSQKWTIDLQLRVLTQNNHLAMDRIFFKLCDLQTLSLHIYSIYIFADIIELKMLVVVVSMLAVAVRGDNGFGAFNGGSFFSQKFPAHQNTPRLTNTSNIKALCWTKYSRSTNLIFKFPYFLYYTPRSFFIFTSGWFNIFTWLRFRTSYSKPTQKPSYPQPAYPTAAPPSYSSPPPPPSYPSPAPSYPAPAPSYPAPPPSYAPAPAKYKTAPQYQQPTHYQQQQPTHNCTVQVNFLEKKSIAKLNISYCQAIGSNM